MTLSLVLEHAFEPQTETQLTVGAAVLQRMCMGHFPGRPLIPGAYLLGFMKAFADGHPELRAQETSHWIGLHRCQLVKPVPPDAQVSFKAPGLSLVEGRGTGLKVELHIQGACAARATLVYAEHKAAHVVPWELCPAQPAAYPDVELLLPHHPPARLVARIIGLEETTLRTETEEQPRWCWPTMLEVAAQTGGLLSGLSSQSTGRAGVVATYDRIDVHRAEAQGPLTCVAKTMRRFASFSQVQFQVLAGAQEVCLEGICTLAMA